MSEQSPINYESTPAPFTDETDVAFHVGDPRLSSVPEARALERAAQIRRMERTQSPEALPDHQQLARLSALVANYRSYEVSLN